MPPTTTNDKPRLTSSLGRRLASRRVHFGLSQVEAAERLGVARQYLSMLETDNAKPSLELLVRAAEAYGVTETWLLHGDEAKVAA